MTDGGPAPGETRPRTLTRPPGERYAATPAGGGPASVVKRARTQARPNLMRAGLFGLTATLVIAMLSALLVAILDLGVGLLALAAVGGWLIGATTRVGAWSTAVSLPSWPVRGVAIAFGGLAWVAGLYGAYLLSLLIRPDSSLTFGERLAQSSFGDWLAPQFGVLQILELLLFVGIAWYSARSDPAATEA